MNRKSILFFVVLKTSKPNDIFRKKETRLRLSTSGRHSDSDTSGKSSFHYLLIKSILFYFWFSKILIQNPMIIIHAHQRQGFFRFYFTSFIKLNCFLVVKNEWRILININPRIRLIQFVYFEQQFYILNCFSIGYRTCFITTYFT